MGILRREAANCEKDFERTIITHQTPLYLPTEQQLIAEGQKEIDRMDQKERE